MRSEGFLFLSGVGGGPVFAARRRELSRVSSRRCAVGIGDEKCLARRVARSFRVAGVENRGNVGVALDPKFAFRVRGIVEDVCVCVCVKRMVAHDLWM